MQLLSKLTLYETRARFFMVGSTHDEDSFRILKIERALDPTDASLCVFDDGIVYTRQEMMDLLAMIESGNKATGGLRRVASCFGIIGFVRFLEGYYIIVVTKRSAVALIGGHYVYHIDDTLIIGVSDAPFRADKRSTADEARYVQSFCQVDLSKNFYFSYTYDITNSLQANMTRSKGYNDMFTWNHFLLSNGFGATHVHPHNAWCLPVIYGFVDQAKIPVFGHDVYLALIARRSRFFAGARFLKRGVNDNGYVANEVETEQIVYDANTTLFELPHNSIQTGNIPAFTSFLQHRGSIPLFWSQDNSQLTPKPPIELNVSDPYYTATSLHFSDLMDRYGSPILVLNLIKAQEKAPRESVLLPEFAAAVEYLNSHLPAGIEKMRYIEWDMARASKSEDVGEVVHTLERIAEEGIAVTGFFHAGREPYLNAVRRAEGTAPGAHPQRTLGRLQTGILRTNCIDCLDRTNAAQFMVGKSALGHQLYALGVLAHPCVPFDSDASNLLNAMYQDHGDTIALQYGGSHLVNTMETYRKMGRWTSHSRDMIENIRRFYSNSFTDAEKQDAINLFLGNFIVNPTGPMIWDLPSDYYLHHDPDPLPRAKKRSYRNWWKNPTTPQNQVDSPQVADEEETAARFTALLRDRNIAFSDYYRPATVTSFDRLYACNMNPATLTSAVAGFEAATGATSAAGAGSPTVAGAGTGSGAVVVDLSPFAVRGPISGANGSESAVVRGEGPLEYGSPGGLVIYEMDGGGSSKWVRAIRRMAEFEGTKGAMVYAGIVDIDSATKYAATRKAEIDKEAPWWTTSALSMRLMDPQVSVAELREYKRYVAQFRPPLVSHMRMPRLDSSKKQQYGENHHPDYEVFHAHVRVTKADMAEPVLAVNEKDQETYRYYATQSGKVGTYLGSGGGREKFSGSELKREKEDARYEAYAKWLSIGQYE